MNNAPSPLQQRTLAALQRPKPLPTFDPVFVDELIEGFETAAVELCDTVDEVYFAKTRIATVLNCEEQYLLDDPFSWNPRVAAGQVSHRAIQLGVNWSGEVSPNELVEAAIERVVDEDNSLGAWLATQPGADVADLRHFAIERVGKFQECFPALDRSWGVQTEARIVWRRAALRLSGTPDLTIGRPQPPAAAKVIIDLKTGWRSSQHAEDLRFYALLETLKVGIPPAKLVTFYLDEGEAVAEDVTEAVLRSAARRTLDAIAAHAEITNGVRSPVRRAGRHCNWCRLASGCAQYEQDRSRVDDPDP